MLASRISIPDEALAELLRRLPNLEKVRRSFGERVFSQGRELWQEGRVEQVSWHDGVLEGTVVGETSHDAVWHLQKKSFLLSCSCPLYAYCPHQVAIYLAVLGAAGPETGSVPAEVEEAQPDQPPRKAAEPHLSLTLTETGVDLHAELRSVAGDCRWPVDGVTAVQSTSAGTFSCDPELMRETAAAIRRAGFHPRGRSGRYRLEDRGLLDAFLDKALPRWREDGWNLELDASLRRLLEGRFQVRSRVSIRSGEDEDHFLISWRLEAGGEELSGADIRALRLYPGRFFRIESGRLVSVQRGALRQQIDELMQIGYAPLQPGPQPVKMHFLARAAALAEDPDVQAVRRDSGLAELRQRLEHFSGFAQVEPPACVAPVLRGYQREGLDFLNFLLQHRFGGVLADDMGLGKTLQALSLVELERLRSGPRTSLVVCPTSVAPNWIEESARFTPELRCLYVGSSRQLASCDFRRWDVVVLSYGLAQKKPPNFPFRFLILDEAQQIKNPQAKRTRAIKSIPAAHRLALTGTPIENSLSELWSLFDFLMPGFLGSQTHFERRYRRPIEQDLADERRMEELVRKVRPFILRRLKSEVAAELPPKSEQNLYCAMTPRQKRLYREVAALVRGQIESDIQLLGWEKSQINILAALMRLRQACCHPALIGPEFGGFGSGKLDGFLEVVESLIAAGSRVVVFSQFVRMLRILAGALEKRGVRWLYLDGSSRDRQETVQKFQRDGSHPVFLMSLKAGGTGLNLTAADYVILFDPWWNPAVENQAIDRIHRIGQNKPVTAYRLIASGTIEEKMLELKKKKQDLADRLLDSQGPDFRSLTREELEELLSADG